MRVGVLIQQTALLMKAAEVVKQRPLILLKSGGIIHEDGTDPGHIHHWDEGQVLNPPIENSWYDVGPGHRGDDPWVKHHPKARADHPLWSTNPRTKKLEMRPDGTPHGFHPIDYANFEINQMLQKHGITGITAQEINQMGIDLFNAERKKAHGEKVGPLLPDENDIRHRQIHVVPYQKQGEFDAGSRQTHSKVTDKTGAPVLGTYFSAHGDYGHELGAKGPRPDSGALHHHAHIGHALRALNEQWKASGKPSIPDEVIDGLNSVKYSGLSPALLTMHRSRPISENELKSWEQRGRRKTADPEEYSYGSGFPHDVVEHLPDEFFSLTTRDGRPVASSASPKRKAWLADIGARHGFDEDELAVLNELAATNFIYPEGQANTGRTGKLVSNMLETHEADPNDPEFVHHRRNYNSQRHTGARLSSANAAGHVVALGYMRGADVMRETNTPYRDMAYDEAYRDLALRLVEAQRKDLETQGVEAPPLVFGEQKAFDPDGHHEAVAADMPVGLGREHVMPEVYHDKFHHGHHMIVPGVDTTAPVEAPPAPEPAPAPTPAPVPAPEAAAPPLPPHRMASPQERAYLEMMGQMSPRAIREETMARPEMPAISAPAALAAQQAARDPAQSFFDAYQPGAPLVFRSESELRNAIGDIQKALESMQMEKALNDGNIMKHVPSKPISLSSTVEVGMFAKSLGLTGHDIRAICSSEGDWGRIAKKWQVSEKTVSIVKASFRGCTA